MKASAIVLAAGEGRRMKSRTPKALLPLGGKPLLLHSVAAFAAVREVREIVLVLPEAHLESVQRRLGRRLAAMKVARMVPGGPRRQDSVQRGLAAIDPASDVVLIHDSARPFVTPDLIRRVAGAAFEKGAAIAALPCRDTVKRVRDGRIVETPDRSALWTAQTPQGFRRALIVGAYAAGHGREDATDDAQIAERAGAAVAVVEGVPNNVKITSSEDLAMVEYLLCRTHKGRRM